MPNKSRREDPAPTGRRRRRGHARRCCSPGRGGVTCGEIDGAVSPGGIALTIECDRDVLRGPGARAHPGPGDPRPADVVAPASCPGEAYQPPGHLARTASTPAWPAGGGSTGSYRWRRRRGLQRADRTPGSAATAAPRPIVVDELRARSAVMGAESISRQCCGLGVHARAAHRTGAGPGHRRRQTPGAPRRRSTTVDDLTVRGDDSSRATAYVVARADASSPWAADVTPRPVDGAGPGRATAARRGRSIYPSYFDVAGQATAGHRQSRPATR